LQIHRAPAGVTSLLTASSTRDHRSRWVPLGKLFRSGYLRSQGPVVRRSTRQIRHDLRSSSTPSTPIPCKRRSLGVGYAVLGNYKLCSRAAMSCVF
jgi:hypothetical protein